MSVASTLELEMLALVNAERAALGLSQLRLNTVLNSAAEIHSDWMLDTNTFSHTGNQGSSAGERMDDAGYDFSGSWRWAENIGWQSARGAAGYSDDVAQVHAALMNSPGHRANILNPNLEEIGIGVVVGTFTTQGRDWQAVMVTQNFATTGADTSAQIDPGTQDGGVDDTVGSEAADELLGTGSSDLLQGFGGNDSVYGGFGFDTLEGGAGDDVLNGQQNADSIVGGAGNDSLIGEDGMDRLEGGSDNDTLYGGAGADRLFGESGDDWISAGSNFGTSVDGVEGGGGNDTIYGDGGFDLLLGGDGDDYINGGGQADDLRGESGNDTLIGGDGFDRLFGGDGDDLLQDFDGFGGLFGGAGADIIQNGDAAVNIFGGSGNDLIEAGGGNDNITGNSGFDTLNGGAGNDTLRGAFNADRFVFADGDGIDVILDFEALNDLEKIDLSDVSAIANLADLDLGSTSGGAATQVGNDVVIATGDGNAIRLLNVDIATLDGNDFIF